MSQQNVEELVLVRTLNAPRELVFKVFTQAEHLVKWWGPKGLTMNVATVDLRPGGLFHYSMKLPDGQEMWGKFVFREIVEPELLVFTNAFSDAEGNTLRHPASPSWPLEILNTLLFEDDNGKTKLTMRGIPYAASEEERQTFDANRSNVQQGFAGTFAQLDEYLATLV
ncbi:SRPBCC domain-containing protein [Paenibacillus rhizovicinus]|uniref:SRPBCC domain-containing protein n=1 Tax=Paenibacillus rhizovicinus TaxID=2704463 RepID=A0A6C0P6W5_9BACL|nr:SRPBCC domain-containing protein [Paenibacillus rhizovicinus]QHW34165.1 SRPBCC domain-containing protein [Paenibacillus rhizovicinus]